MRDDRGFERSMQDWLADGSDRTPQTAIDAVLLAIKTTHQERDFHVPWRTPSMTTPVRIAAAIAIVAIIGVASLNLVGSGPAIVGGPLPTPTTIRSPAPTPTPDLLDTATWKTYVSERYGFSIAHPADWSEDAADRDWVLADDADDWLSPGQEAFMKADAIRFSAWSVSVDPGTTADAWIEDYCARQPTCTGILDEAVPVSVGPDRHPGLLTPLGDVDAFVLVGDTMYVFAIWREETESSVAKYGGGRRLLEAYLSTVRLLPPGPLSATTPGPS